MDANICSKCGLHNGCEKCYLKGKNDMLKAFEKQLEFAVEDSGKQAHMGIAQRFFVKSVLGNILGELRKRIGEEMKKEAIIDGKGNDNSGVQG